MTLDELVAALAGDGEGSWSVEISENWTQGRTIYGGITAALGLAVARLAVPGLPPLRSAQVAFVGPLPPQVRFRAELLRQGRTAAFVRVDAMGGDVVGAAMTFVFAEERESAATLPHPPEPVGTGAAMAVPDFVRFATNFDHWFVEGVTHFVDRMVRMKEPSALDPEIELLAVGDLLPPPALFNLPELVPLSSMDWQVDLLHPARRSDDRKWRLQSVMEMHERGLSTQTMRMWDGEGRLQAAGRQLVTLFG